MAGRQNVYYAVLGGFGRLGVGEWRIFSWDSSFARFSMLLARYIHVQVVGEAWMARLMGKNREVALQGCYWVW